MALLGHTIVVGGEKVTGKTADTIRAAYDSIQAAIRLLRPGNKNGQITSAISKICEAYGVNAVEGVLSHEIQRHLIDGNNVILNKQTDDQRVAEVEFGVNQIFVLDCIVSSGEGRPKESENKITVYKRALDSNYDLKTKAGREFFGQLNKRFPSLAFSLRAFEDETVTKICIKSI